MYTSIRRTVFRAAATVVLGTALAGGAVLAGVVAAPSVAQAATQGIPWEPIGNPPEAGGLLFFNAEGEQITGGSIDTAPLAAYVEGTSNLATSDDTVATLDAYTPVNGKPPGAWTGTQLSFSTTYPNTSAPAPLKTSTLPVVTGSATDNTLASDIFLYPNKDTSDDGYAGLYVLRLYTSGSGIPESTSYDSADIKVIITGTTSTTGLPEGTWSVVYPTTSTAVAANLTSPQKSGTTVTFIANVTPSIAAGSVQFKGGTTDLGGPVTVVGGTASLSTSSLPVGTQLINAVFTPATDAYSYSTGNTEFTIDVPPAVTTQPASQAVDSGKSVTFTAAASGTPAPTVQWQSEPSGSGTFTNISGATSASYTFTATSADSGTQYRAVFTNPVGSATSDPATLTVDVPPAVTTQPASQAVDSGKPVTFTAAASGTPTPTVQWQSEPSGSGTFTDISGATSDSYTFTATTADSGTQYRAVFTNTAGTATTNAATLTVSPSPPTITTQPTSQTVDAGTSVTFTAGASGTPTPTVQWQSEPSGSGTFTNISGATSDSYTFTATSADNGTRYRAVFTDPGGSVTSDAATLTVDYAPTVTTQPTSQTVNAGTSVTFTAGASGNPTPTVQWQSEPSGSDTFTDIAGATSDTYTFTTTTADSGTQYRAVFTNTVGTATTNAATLTAGIRPAVTTQPTSQTVNSGTSVTFSAAASGNPAPTVQWQSEPSGSDTFTDIAGANSDTYTFTATTADNGTQYRAVFTNAVGSATSDAATLIVDYAPTVTTQPTSQTVNSGTSVTFSAAASGNPAPTVQWQSEPSGSDTFTDIAGANSDTYTFTATTADNGTQYRAVFTNTVGTATTNAATLTAGIRPAVTTQPTSQTVNSGTSVTFSAAASGNPAPTVQWQSEPSGSDTFTDIAGANSDTYTFTATTADNGTQYRAVFTNAVGSATSDAATLTVDYAPTVTTQPTSQTVNSGTSVTFSAAASGNPAPTVQWQSEPSGSDTFTDIAGATSDTYTFTTTTADSGTQYRAVFTNTVGSATTNAGTLTVTTEAGYWLVAGDGGVFAYGNAQFYGSEGGQRLNAPIVGIAATPSGDGYWLVASDGGVFAFGDAQFYGSEGGQRLNAPIVGIAATPSGDGYWLVASDGGVFAFGDAQFYGSEGGQRLNAPVVGIAATPSGDGYWLVASDGGVFSFGDAQFYGSEGGQRLNAPVVGIAATPSGDGYWLVASDGGVFSFGDAQFYGSEGGQRLNAPVVGIAATPSGDGYWLVASDGGVFSFGDAQFHGSAGTTPLNEAVVGMAGG